MRISDWSSDVCSSDLAQLTARFDYAFVSSRSENNLYPALMHDRVIEGPFSIGGIPIQPFEQQHGPDFSLGFRVGDIGYSTDASALDDRAFAILAGVKLWVVDCLRDEPHPTHRSEEHTSELQSLMRISYAVFCLKKTNKHNKTQNAD